MKKLNVPKFSKANLKATFKSRVFRIGTYSAFIALAAVAVAVIINLFVSEIPSKFIKTDMTSQDLFSISDQTEKIVSSLNDNVTVYLICQSGSEDSVILQLLENYEDLSDNITVIRKDPVIYPTFATQFTDADVTDNSIVVVSGDKSKYIAYEEIYLTDYDYSSYYTTGNYTSTTSFDGENKLTSAIDYVTSDNLPALYYLTGHGEYTLNETFTSAVSGENMDLSELNLLTNDSVPTDTDCLLILGPTSDISEEELTKIIDYLEAGGNMLLISDYSDTDLPNIDSLMANYGTETVDGIVVEGNSDYCMSGYNYYLLPEIVSHEITDPLISGNYYALVPLAQGIRILSDYRSTLTISPLLTTSDDSYSKAAGYDMSTTSKEEGDIDGPFNLGVAITESYNDVDTNIVWYSTTGILDDSVNEAVSGSNLDMFINTLGWLCDRESSISIHSKSLDYTYLTLTDSQVTNLSLVFIGLIPFSFIAAGTFVVIRRKRR